MKKVPPYFVNPDGEGCSSACMLMGYEFFFPEKQKLSFAQIETLTRRRPNEGTWPHGIYYALRMLGFEIAAYEPAMDYVAFVADPKAFFERTLADKPDVLEWILSHYDLNAAARDAEELLADGFLPETEVPDIALIRKYVTEGWVVLPNVDMYALHGEEGGPEGHHIAIFGYQDGLFFYHDPDMPSSDGRALKISEAHLQRAWVWTGDGKQEMVAFRPKF